MLYLLLALALGYVIGLLQFGVKITISNEGKTHDEPVEYNKSVGIDEIKQYYDETNGMNKF